jgi:hypothetical protein
MLSIAEKFYLVTTRETTGRPLTSANGWQYGLVGAVFCDMVMGGQIAFRDKKIFRRKPGNLREPVYKIFHERLRKANREKKLMTWMQQLYFRTGRIKREIRKSLIKKGQIRKIEKSAFGFISYNIYQSLDDENVRRLKEEILEWSDTPSANDESIVFLSVLVMTCGPWSRIAGRETARKTRKEAMAILNNRSVEYRYSDFLSELIKSIKSLLRMSSGSVAVVAASG